jgi:hypothetical protein
MCNSLDSTLRTALASFYVSDTEGIRLEDFEIPVGIPLCVVPPGRTRTGAR